MELGILVDVAIGVLAVLVLFSIATSAVHEFIADKLLNLRGKSLEQAIEKLLAREVTRSNMTEDDLPSGEVLRDFYADPDIRVLMNGERLPSAIEGRRYALTVLKILSGRHHLKAALDERIEAARVDAEATVRDVTDDIGLDAAGDAIAEKLGKGAAAVNQLANESVETVDAVLKRLEGEFDELMDRASGWYLRQAKVNLFVIGLILAVGSNIDILRYADRMVTSGDVSSRIETVKALIGSEELERRVEFYEAREAARAAALAGDKADDPVATEASSGSEGDAPQTAVDPEKLEGLGEEIGFIVGQLDALDVKIGWDCRQKGQGGLDLPFSGGYCEEGQALPMPSPSQVIGWVLIAFGVTFGAQVWFDLVKRLVRLRTSGLTGGLATRPQV